MAIDPQLPRARQAVQWQLRAGLALAALLMLAGLVVRLLAGHAEAPGLPLGELTSADLTLSDRLMGLGVLVLGLTPGLRVVMLLIVWARERDWRFAGVAAVVLALLAVAIAVGGG